MKIFLDTVGCRLNQSEIEQYAREFRAAGHQLVPNMEEAELMVLNSCSVTAAAASDSRQKIRQGNRAGIEQIVVTGCMSTLQPEETAQMSGVIQVIPNPEKDELVSKLLQIKIPDYDLEPFLRKPIPGSRLRTRAFIKVQDGCDNKCAFCITTLARGQGKSRSIQQVADDIDFALKGGAQEVVLTGVHLGSWGYDFEQPSHLKNLIVRLLEITDPPRLRISSLEPWDLDESFFDLWQDPRLCRHLHLPLQSGSANTLRRMARKVTPESYTALIEKARAKIPGVAITTDLIAGFPGESEAEHLESVKFVESIGFADAHVFVYSERPGTAAARMPDQVHNFTRKERSTALREISTKSSQIYRNAFVGQELPVLWESIKPGPQLMLGPRQESGTETWQLVGLTDNYLKVQAVAEQPIWNQITKTKLLSVNARGMRGEVMELPDQLIIS